MKKQISKNIFDFSNLIKALKKEKRKKIFLTPFWFKTNFKKQKPNFWIHFLILNKKWISKSSFIFQFLLWNWTMKNEKFSKFVLFWNQKRNYTFIRALKVPFNFLIKIEMEKDFFCISISFQDWKLRKDIFIWKLKNKICVFRFPIFILFQNTKLTALSTYQSNFNKS